ncbi:8566_t:CDS:2, partial [Ambispora gerdemannii]
RKPEISIPTPTKKKSYKQALLQNSSTISKKTERQINLSDNTRSPTLRSWNQTNLNNSHNTHTDNSLNSISSIYKILNTLTTQTPSSKTSTHTQFDDSTASHNHNDNINDLFM